MNRKATTADKAGARKEWLACIDKLLRQIESWVQDEGWEAAREDREITEELVGTYAAPVLKLRAPNGLLYVEPVARDVVGADGRIDVYAWPSLHRLLLIRQEGRWSVKTDSGVDWPEKWGRKAFLKLAESLTKAP